MSKVWYYNTIGIIILLVNVIIDEPLCSKNILNKNHWYEKQ